VLSRLTQYLSATCRARSQAAIYVALTLSLFATPMLAHAKSITLIYDDSSNYQAHFVSDISDKLSTVDGVTLTTLSSLELPIASLNNNLPDILISLNDSMSEKIIAAQLQTSVFHVLTTLASSRRYALCLPSCSEQLPNHHFFVLDPLPARQAP